jgi:hypothetical protein
MRQGLLSGSIEPRPELEGRFGGGLEWENVPGARKAGKIGSGSSVVHT